MAEEKKPAKKVVERDWDDISEIRKSKAAPHEETETTEEVVAKPPPAPARVSISDEPGAVLDDMKVHDVNGAIVRADGVIVHSTMPLTDAAAGMMASAANITDALMKRSGDVPREIEITFGSTILVLIPIGTYIFCGSVKDREQKKIIREYAEKARKTL